MSVRALIALLFGGLSCAAGFAGVLLRDTQIAAWVGSLLLLIAIVWMLRDG